MQLSTHPRNGKAEKQNWLMTRVRLLPAALGNHSSQATERRVTFPSKQRDTDPLHQLESGTVQVFCSSNDLFHGELAKEKRVRGYTMVIYQPTCSGFKTFRKGFRDGDLA